MNLDPLIQAQIDGRLLDCAYLLRIASDPPVCAWSGSGDMVLGDDVYRGLGVLPDVPSIQSLINGVAARIELSLSGVDAEVVGLASQEAVAVRGKQVKIGLLFLDRDLQPLAQPIWVASDYTADVLTTDSTSDASFGRQRTIMLSIGSATTGRRRPRLNFWTRVQQRLRSPTDGFCDLVSRYTNDTEMKWPP